MRRRLCDKLHGHLSQLLLAHPAVIDRSPAICPESRFVPAFDAHVWGSLLEYGHDFWCGKARIDLAM